MNAKLGCQKILPDSEIRWISGSCTKRIICKANVILSLCYTICYTTLSTGNVF